MERKPMAMEAWGEGNMAWDPMFAEPDTVDRMMTGIAKTSFSLESRFSD